MKLTDLQDKCLRVSILPSFPLVNLNLADVNDNTGYFVDVLDILADLMHFQVVYQRPPDGRWGSKNDDGTWNGMVGELTNNQSDISIGEGIQHYPIILLIVTGENNHQSEVICDDSSHNPNGPRDWPNMTFATDAPQEDKLTDLRGNYLRISVLESLPLTKINGSNVSGYFVDVLDILADLMHFQVVYQRPPDGLWGSKNDDGTWNGMVGELTNNQSDISIGGLSITEDRSQVIDFTYPLIDDDVTLNYRVLEPAELDFQAFFQVFQSGTWISVGVAFILVVIGLCLTSQMGPNKLGILRSCEITWVNFILRDPNGHDHFANTSSLFSYKIWFAIMSLFSLIVMTVYTGDLTSKMTASGPVDDLTSFQDIIDRKWQLLLKPGTSIYDHVARSIEGSALKNVFQNQLFDNELDLPLADVLLKGIQHYPIMLLIVTGKNNHRSEVICDDSWHNPDGPRDWPNMTLTTEVSQKDKLTDLRGNYLRISVLEALPLTQINGSNVSGYFVDVLDILADLMHFQVVYQRPPDGLWGSKNDDGTWNGMVGELTNNQSDISIGGLSITEDRSQVIDFTYPLIDDDVTLNYRVLEPAELNFHAFFQVFQTGTWISIGVAFILVVIGLCLTSQMGPNKFGILRSCEITWVNFILRDPNGHDHFADTSSLFSYKIWFAIMSLFSLIVMTVYTGDLTSKMTASGPVDDLTSFQGKKRRSAGNMIMTIWVPEDKINPSNFTTPQNSKLVWSHLTGQTKANNDENESYSNTDPGSSLEHLEKGLKIKLCRFQNPIV
eukprot:TCALIF_05531-PA protein Name:"Similar to KBP Probable glutamate receptor (Gallus gallus)" AED:0.18 eAED:0.18 QI:0/0/0/0.5/0.6/0.5/6/0/780